MQQNQNVTKLQVHMYYSKSNHSLIKDIFLGIYLHSTFIYLHSKETQTHFYQRTNSLPFFLILITSLSNHCGMYRKENTGAKTRPTAPLNFPIVRPKTQNAGNSQPSAGPSILLCRNHESCEIIQTHMGYPREAL